MFFYSFQFIFRKLLNREILSKDKTKKKHMMKAKKVGEVKKEKEKWKDTTWKIINHGQTETESRKPGDDPFKSRPNFFFAISEKK